jgi:hypothetical protein
MAQERIQYRSAYLLEAPETRMADSIDSASNGKRFPKPGKFFVNPEQNYPDADLVIIDNLLIIAEDTAGLVNLIKDAVAENKRVHLVHAETVTTGNAASPKYKIGFSSPERFMAPAIMNLCKDYDIKISTVQSELRTNKVVIRDPLFAVFPHSSNSGIKTQSVSLETDKPALPTGLTNTQAKELMSKNVAALFGVSL